jgi:hypothetical protein
MHSLAIRTLPENLVFLETDGSISEPCMPSRKMSLMPRRSREFEKNYLPGIIYYLGTGSSSAAKLARILNRFNLDQILDFFE